MTTADNWRKSSRSGNETNCVLLNGTLDAVQDSKNLGVVLPRCDVRKFVRLVKMDRLGALTR